MEQKTPNWKQQAQKKYRRSQENKGLARFELQVDAKTKQHFDTLVAAIADELGGPLNQQRRLAKARAQVFDEITQGVMHEFFTLKDQIAALKAEIKVLSPRFFKVKGINKTPIPESIKALTNDPNELKALLSQTYTRALKAEYDLARYEKLYDQSEEGRYTSQKYSDELEKRLAQYE